MTKHKKQNAEYKQSIGHFFLLRKLAGVSSCQVLDNLLQLTVGSGHKKPGDFFESGFKNRFLKESNSFMDGSWVKTLNNSGRMIPSFDDHPGAERKIHCSRNIDPQKSRG